MDKKASYHTILGLGLLLSLPPVTARADFIIEFTDGRHVTVGRYVDEEQTIRVYTPWGVIGFRKEDVKRITEADTNQSMDTPLEMVRVRPSVPTQASSPDPLGDKEKAEVLGSADKAGKERAAEGGKATEAEREHIDQQYQDSTEEFNELWKEHIEKISSGIPETALQENLRKLDELDRERRELIRAARQQVDPDNLPTWAQ